ncbi:unnamed protein product [Paramecium primaurelia]|uniref:Uncharacterized protein n=1 Tax=Paramecium primaurelia TaxID=5886 RepID=A0A8S1QT90_PARPR|nr:unnamed protein product [Paramecium primaurelia]
MNKQTSLTRYVYKLLEDRSVRQYDSCDYIDIYKEKNTLIASVNTLKRFIQNGLEKNFDVIYLKCEETKEFNQGLLTKIQDFHLGYFSRMNIYSSNHITLKKGQIFFIILTIFKIECIKLIVVIGDHKSYVKSLKRRQSYIITLILHPTIKNMFISASNELYNSSNTPIINNGLVLAEEQKLIQFLEFQLIKMELKQFDLVRTV